MVVIEGKQKEAAATEEVVSKDLEKLELKDAQTLGVLGAQGDCIQLLLSPSTPPWNSKTFCVG